MGKYRRSAIIKLMRNSLDITQEQLVGHLGDEICSLETLSRVENGKQKIKDETFNLLMEKMGASINKTEPLLSTDELKLFEKKNMLYKAMIDRKYDDAEKILEDICCILDMQYPLNRQFYIENKAQIDYKLKRINEVVFLEKLEEAVKCTIKKYDQISLSKWPFTIQEAVIIMNMATAHYNSGNVRKSIELLYDLKNALGQNYMDKQSAATIWLSVVKKLSSYLGNIERYEEAIELSQKAIELSREVENGDALSGFFYEIMWNKKEMMKKSNESDEKIKQMEKAYITKAYHIARAMNNTVMISFLERKIQYTLQ